MTATYEGRPCKRCGGTTRYASARSCVVCKLEAVARRPKTNPERQREYDRAWKRSNREYKRAYDRERRKAQPERGRAHVAKRRATKLRATPAWLDPRDLLPIYHEAARLTAETGVLHHVDHIVPLRGDGVCGLHVPWNLQAIPAIENLKKGNRLETHSVGAI
jgi:hypothetical protein